VTGLRERLATQTRAALDAGVLGPIDTETRVVEDGGIGFVVREVTNLRRKAAAAESGEDPFSPPYEEALLVGELPPHHVGLLNKFPVLDEHLLIVTREYAPQTELLTRSDCEALLWGLQEIDGLMFYNGGTEAGASQPHKHLQLVPLPLASVGEPLPVAPALDAVDLADSIGRSPMLPFRHAVARMAHDWWRDPRIGAAALQACYRELLAAVGLEREARVQSGPYNLLATRDWIWLVPRRQEKVGGVSVNALAYAGALLAPDAERLAVIESRGPMTCLAEAAA